MKKSVIFKTLFSLAAAWLMTGTMQRVQAQNHLIFHLTEGGTYEMDIPAGAKVSLPIQVGDAATGSKERLSLKNVERIEATDKSHPIDGCTEWEVRRVLTPSVIKGKHNTELRLLDVVKRGETGTVYKWEVTTFQNGSNRFGLWYGILPKGAEHVYPYIQDSRVWFRDLKMTMRREAPAFVEAANAKYNKGKDKLRNQASLKQHPTEILELQVAE